jgi:hypothetical protein
VRIDIAFNMQLYTEGMTVQSRTLMASGNVW